MKNKELEELNKKEQSDKLVKDIAKDLHAEKKEHHTLIEEEEIIEEKLNDEILDIKDKISNNKLWSIIAICLAVGVAITVGCLFGFGVI